MAGSGDGEVSLRAKRFYGVFLASRGFLVDTPDALFIRLSEMEQGLGCCTFYKYLTKAVVMWIGLLVYFGGPHAVIVECSKSGLHFILAAICEGGFCLLFNLAMMTTASANVAAMVLLNPMWCIMWTFLLTWERTPRYTIIATIITFVCGFIIFMNSRSSTRGVESLLGDLLGVLCGMAFGLYLTICADASKRYPEASLMGAIAVGATIATAGSYVLIDGNIFEDCYPRNGVPGYFWAVADGLLAMVTFVLLNLSTKHCPSAVTGLLLIIDLIAEPYLVWLFLGEQPLQTTVVVGAILCATLVGHEVIAAYDTPEKSL